jgi:tryptophan synthase
MKLLCKIADSFIYVVSRMGVTGATGTLNAELPQLLQRVHTYSGGVPSAVGFGVSTRDHFLSVAKIAEGVVIGSQIITILGNAPEGQRAKKVQEYCAEISGPSSANTIIKEVGTDTIHATREPNGDVQVDATITNGQNGIEPGLADQIEALNSGGKANTSVSLCRELL